MSKIVIELHDFAETWKANLLVSLIEDTIGSEEEVKEIRLEN
jgi:hypothetical protein